MDGLTCRMKEYIQPFERRLALQELHALTDASVVPIDGNDVTALTFSVAKTRDANTLRGALAYWRSIGGNKDELTVQLRSEATSLIARNGVPVEELLKTVCALVPSKLPNRRCLRYATHGLHEYRGKFFPQLVRALINVARLPEDAIVLDPMCGSGTSLVEARLSRRRCYGLDINPLSGVCLQCQMRSPDAAGFNTGGGLRHSSQRELMRRLVAGRDVRPVCRTVIGCIWSGGLPL